MRRVVLFVAAVGCSDPGYVVTVRWKLTVDGQVTSDCHEATTIDVEVETQGRQHPCGLEPSVESFRTTRSVPGIFVGVSDANGQGIFDWHSDETLFGDESVSVPLNLGITMRATWTIACADVGATTVALVGSGGGFGYAVADRFPCDDGQGVTAPHTPGDYAVHAELRDASDRVLGSTAETQVYLGPYGPQVDLGALVFSP